MNYYNKVRGLVIDAICLSHFAIQVRKESRVNPSSLMAEVIAAGVKTGEFQRKLERWIP